jgi:hypothetical protein
MRREKEEGDSPVAATETPRFAIASEARQSPARRDCFPAERGISLLAMTH